NVSNSYVLTKLKVILFPWTHKPWGRRIRRSEQNEQVEYQSPRDDINAPDLYIPLMSIMTYVLLSALQHGLKDNFRASVLGEVASRAVAVIIFDFLVVKMGCFLLNVGSGSQSAELLAYGGYKFVGIVFTLIVSLLLGPTWIWTERLVFFYVWLAMGFFLLRSLRSLVLPSQDGSGTGSATQHRRRRITFLFIEAMTQLLWMGILVRA
ncbi:hypothetical protein DL96DRAFT_1099866, partial [Flagelloscypha sp. PMI_526]